MRRAMMRSIFVTGLAHCGSPGFGLRLLLVGAHLMWPAGGGAQEEPGGDWGRVVQEGIANGEYAIRFDDVSTARGSCL